MIDIHLLKPEVMRYQKLQLMIKYGTWLKNTEPVKKEWCDQIGKHWDNFANMSIAVVKYQMGGSKFDAEMHFEFWQFQLLYPGSLPFALSCLSDENGTSHVRYSGCHGDAGSNRGRPGTGGTQVRPSR